MIHVLPDEQGGGHAIHGNSIIFPFHSQVLAHKSFQGGAPHSCLEPTFWDRECWTFPHPGMVLAQQDLPFRGKCWSLLQSRLYEQQVLFLCSGLKPKGRKREPSSGVSEMGGRFPSGRLALGSGTSGGVWDAAPKVSCCPLCWIPAGGSEESP